MTASPGKPSGWLRFTVKISVKIGPSSSGRAAGLLPWSVSWVVAKGTYSEVGRSAGADLRAWLDALPRRADDKRISVRNGPSVFALVLVVCDCMVTSSVVVTLATAGDVPVIYTAFSAIAFPGADGYRALGIG